MSVHLNYTVWYRIHTSSTIYKVWQKSSPLMFFSVFSAISQLNLLKHFTSNWYVKCYSVKNRQSLRLFNMNGYRFLALKMFKLKMLLNFRKPVITLLPMMSQWQFDNQYFIFFINYHFWNNRRVPTEFSLEQESMPAYTACSARNWLWANCPDFITKDQWFPNSPNINPMTIMYDMQCCCQLKTKPKTIAEVKEALQVICGNLLEGQINNTVKDFLN